MDCPICDAQVTACPECGTILEYTCYHDGVDIPAVSMPLIQALKLNHMHMSEMVEQFDYMLGHFCAALEEASKRKK